MITRSPRVTVALPVYNGGEYLAAAIESVLHQSFQDFEFVISDNASTDGTEEICRSAASRDARVRYVRHPQNRGASWNHNHLVDLARGELFNWVGADDLNRPEFLARCVTALDEIPEAVLAYPRTVAIDEDGNTLYEYSPGWELRQDDPGERLRSVILKGGHWVNADALTGVVRTGPLRRTRLIPAYQGGDKRPLGELSLMGKFIEIPELLHLRRFHQDSSGSNNPFFLDEDHARFDWMLEFFRGSRLPILFPSWALLWDHLLTIWSSQLPLTKKLGLCGTLPRACSWYRRAYLGELSNARYLLRRRRDKSHG